jgi:hypothetical protein
LTPTGSATGVLAAVPVMMEPLETMQEQGIAAAPDKADVTMPSELTVKVELV